MSFRRIDQKESYNVTADWLKDFANKMSKEGSFLDNIGGIVEQTKNKYGSIEEKMVDIRQRVGFDTLASIRDSEEEKVATASDPCCDKCADGHSCKISTAGNLDVEQMKAILSYAKQMIQKNPDPNLSSVAVIEECRSRPDLNWNNLKINEQKFKQAVQTEIEKTRPVNVSTPEYVSPITDSSSEHQDTTAEYFSHSAPKL